MGVAVRGAAIAIVRSLVFLVVGCAPDRRGSVDAPGGAPAPIIGFDSSCSADRTFTLTPVVTIGDALEGDTFGQIADVAVDDGDDIYVLDGRSGRVHVFGPDGGRRRSFGRRGDGPGDTRYPSSIDVTDSGHVIIGDRQPARVVVFDAIGSVVREITTSAMARGLGETALLGEWSATADGSIHGALRFVSGERDSVPVVLVRLDSAGAAADTLAAWKRPGGNLRFRIWGAYPSWALAGDGRFVTAHGETHELKLYSAAGELERIVRGSSAPRTVDDALAERLLETYLAQMAAEGQSEFMRRTARERAVVAPVVRAVDHVWISRPDGAIWTKGPAADWDGDYPVRSRFHVFSPEGDFAGCADVPAAFRLLAVRGDRLVGEWRDELDVPYVRAYRVDTW